MKFTKGKFASVAAAAVLAGTMGFMPATALASTVTDTATGLQKTWEVPSSAQFTDETFNFTLAYTSAEALNGNATATPTKDDAAFTSETLSLSKADFSGDGTTKTASKTLAQVFEGIDFSKPGTYSFTLTERAGTNQNIVYNADNATYTIKVSVVWATDGNGAPTSETTVSAVRIYSGDTKVESASFNNTDPNGNVTVSKTVKGVLANTNDDFSFSAELKDKTGAVLTGSYNYTKTDAKGTTTTGTYKSGDTFTLKSGETFRIENLPAGATYTVTETDDKGYDSTTVTAEGTTNSTQKDTKTTDASGAGAIANGDTDSVAFVNNMGFVPPATGITMDTLPFVAVGVVAVAGGAALVISRRRHAGEDF